MKQILKIVALLTIALIPLQTAYIMIERYLGGAKWQYGTEVLYVTQLLVGIALIIQLVTWWRERRPFSLALLRTINFKNNFQTLSLLVFVVWLLVSLFWSTNIGLSWYYATQLLLAISLAVVVRVNKITTCSIAWTLCISGLLQSVIIFWQWGSQRVSANMWLGISEKLPETVGTAVVALGDERWLRVSGTFTHPNTAGGFLAIISVLTVWLALRESHKYRLWIIAMLPIFIFALGLTFSRSAWLAAFIGVTVLIGHSFLRKNNFHRNITLVVISTISALSFFTIYSDMIMSRVQLTTLIEQHSITERVDGVRGAFDQMSATPLQGVGIGGYTLELSEKFPHQPAWMYQPVHNMWLLIATEIGIVGTLLFAGIFINAVWRSRNSSLVVGLLATIFIISLFDHYLWTSWSGLLIWWVVVLGIEE